MQEIIQQIHALNQKLIEQDIFMGGRGFYKIENPVPFPDAKNLYFAVSVKEHQKCLLEFAPPDIDHIGMQKFLRRALFLMVLEHEKGIITAKDFSIDPSRSFVILDWVEGLPVLALLKHTRLSIKEALWILVDLTYALEHLNEFAFVHRNINPKNIIIEKVTGKTFLGGVEYIAFSDFLQTKLEMVNNGYVSPELMQSLLFPDSQILVTHWSDVYSLGAVFFHMITGEQPFPKRTDLVKWAKRAPIPDIDSSLFPRKERKYCQYLIDNTMHRNFLKRWSARHIREYAMAFLENSDRRKDMTRWL